MLCASSEDACVGVHVLCLVAVGAALTQENKAFVGMWYKDYL